jgi:hypothetical protein
MQFVSLDPATTGVIDSERDGVVAGPGVAQNFALDTWHTLRMHKGGSNIACYLNGSLIDVFQISEDVVLASYIALYGYQADVWFRNLKLWTLAMPT